MSQVIYENPNNECRTLFPFFKRCKNHKGKFWGPGLVEAEHCYTSGTWKVWDVPEFSNGRCINNEDPSQMGQASPSSVLYLNFKGTGVSIIYRQDTWYGILTVEIDNKIVGSINQQGPVKNQAEAYFEAGSMAQHHLVLRGSREAGVITVDAIRIYGA